MSLWLIVRQGGICVKLRPRAWEPALLGRLVLSNPKEALGWSPCPMAPPRPCRTSACFLPLVDRPPPPGPPILPLHRLHQLPSSPAASPRQARSPSTTVSTTWASCTKENRYRLPPPKTAWRCATRTTPGSLPAPGKTIVSQTNLYALYSGQTYQPNTSSLAQRSVPEYNAVNSRSTAAISTVYHHRVSRVPC